jgi:hypothetical protein
MLFYLGGGLLDASRVLSLGSSKAPPINREDPLHFYKNLLRGYFYYNCCYSGTNNPGELSVENCIQMVVTYINFYVHAI